MSYNLYDEMQQAPLQQNFYNETEDTMYIIQFMYITNLPKVFPQTVSLWVSVRHASPTGSEKKQKIVRIK